MACKPIEAPCFDTAQLCCQWRCTLLSPGTKERGSSQQSAFAFQDGGGAGGIMAQLSQHTTWPHTEAGCPALAFREPGPCAELPVSSAFPPHYGWEEVPGWGCPGKALHNTAS